MSEQSIPIIINSWVSEDYYNPANMEFFLRNGGKSGECIIDSLLSDTACKKCVICFVHERQKRYVTMCRVSLGFGLK